MAQSLAQLYVHLVFSTKERRPFIPPQTSPRLHGYLARTLDALSCPSVQVGGVADHLHLLFRLSKNLALSEAVKHAKIESSKWMKQEGNVGEFAWQTGYGGFSVSASHVDSVTAYIANQPAHHQARSFQEEFRILLRKYNVAYDEAYLWD